MEERDGGQALAVAPDVDQEMEYATDPWGKTPRGRCRLRWWKDQRAAVVTELDDNPGMSVTNAAEYVHAAVLGLLGPNLTHVEHYPENSARPATLDVVTVGPVTDGRPMGTASWRPLPDHLGWLRAALS